MYNRDEQYGETLTVAVSEDLEVLRLPATMSSTGFCQYVWVCCGSGNCLSGASSVEFLASRQKGGTNNTLEMQLVL